MSTTYDKTKYQGGFWSFMAVQSQGAFSDNLFKWILIFLLLKGLGDSADVESSGKIAATAGMLFAVPYIIFPGIFGALADRYSKQKVIVLTKVMEIAIMAVGGFAVYMSHQPFLWVVLFFMATQSALFGPAKYGILPEGLPEDKLSWGNGVIQMLTMVAIIAGTGVAGPLFQYLDGRDTVYMASGVLVALAAVGAVTSLSVFKPPAADPSRPLTMNPFAGMPAHISAMTKDKWLGLTVIGYTYFWFAGALLQANLVPFGKATLGLDEMQMGLTQVALAMGIGVGAMAAGLLSRGKVEVGLIPLGALGMTVFSGLLSIATFELNAVYFLLFCLGFAGGVFDVPLAATIQQRAPEKIRGGLIATVNMFSFIGIFTAGAFMWILGEAGFGPYAVFAICAVLSAVIGIGVTYVLPVFLLRFVLWILANTIYRLRVLGNRNIPEHSGALLIANHSSFLDALIIIASIDRPVRFIMHQGVYEIPWIKPLAKLVGAIPITPGGGPREVVQSLRSATEALKNGQLVCIFAEGQITRTGQMLPFRKGFERIMKDSDAPIIPVHIDQIWGSIFSFADGKFFWKWPDKIPYPVTISYGEQMPSNSNAFDVRSAIQTLGSDAFRERSDSFELLHRQFMRKARRKPFAKAIADARSGELTNMRVLAGSVILAGKLKKQLADDEMVGVLLPQGVGGVLVNVALQIMGKVPVNLNYTASEEAIRSAAKRCDMKHVITAHAFLEQFSVHVPGEAIYVEDIMASVSKVDRIKGILKGMFMPIVRLERSLGAKAGRTADDLATIIFSSGSEGEPKGVMLSHFNVASNIESALQIFPYEDDDCLVGILPFFHSFGFTATLWIPLTRNFRAIFHPNPTEARAIGKLIQKHQGTIMFSTSTFLQGFIRRCSATQMSSLRIVIAGAEKLAPRVRDAFKEKFGIEPLEGYGTTECAPIVSLNVPDFRAPGFYQKGTRRGSIGHPLPGISVRILDPDTREVLQNGEAGLLCVKGPNVMKGYLGMPEKTDNVLRDGWYETGDISTIDDEGFITITDRLARFSKIGGEMVSHTKVEDALEDIVAGEERTLAIASVEDETKGERLVVLHTLDDDDFEALLSRLDETGLPNLWIPKKNAFYKIEEIPVLGTGKMDIKGVKTLARQLDVGE